MLLPLTSITITTNDITIPFELPPKVNYHIDCYYHPLNEQLEFISCCCDCSNDDIIAVTTIDITIQFKLLQLFQQCYYYH